MSQQDQCAAAGLMPLDMAVSAITGAAKAVCESENLALSQAHKRVLAENVYATLNVPPADNSAMDGYALNSADLLKGCALQIVGTALAGQPFSGEIQAGQCVRIMTGGILPAGADAVVMQEHVKLDGHHIRVTDSLSPGTNVRRAGDDIAQGSLVLPAGSVLGPAHLALLASLGLATVCVFRKLRIGLMSTGDELTPPGEPLAPGAIYESNSVALQAKLQDLPTEVLNYGIVKDDKTSLRKIFSQADQECDLLISSGGVSVGDADFVKEILSQTGRVSFWQVAIKPGKPFAFGQLTRAFFCGLPGNPVSSYVTFEQLVLPLIRQLSGQLSATDKPAYLLATATEKVRKRPGRADFQRAWCKQDALGNWQVIPQGNQSSGVMSSVTNANCYLLLDRQQGDVAAGDSVKVLPFAFL